MHVGRAGLEAGLAGVADKLGRRVEAHRLAVQQRGGEDRGIVMLHPGRHVDQQGEARRMALRKPIGAEALDLLEATRGEVGIVAARDHAADELRSEEHTSELQSLMRISYAVFCLKKKTQ